MSRTKHHTNAMIVTPEGVYYELDLNWLPKVGELIDFTSYLEPRESGKRWQHFEVTAIVHKITDRTDESNLGSADHQYATIFVRPSQSIRFDNDIEKAASPDR